MKYIVLRIEHHGVAAEMPVVFPNAFVHADVAKALCALPGMTGATPVAAGFMNSTKVGGKAACHGRSDTLGLGSRGTVDDELISHHDYFEGFVCSPN